MASSFLNALLLFTRRRVPILTWRKGYKKSDFIGDLIAGTTVGMTVVPQSLAYANIAGLPPEYGLRSSFLGVFVYVILGSCRQATVGPTAVMGLLTYQTCGPNFPSCATLAAFYSGLIEILMAVISLGWIVGFISEPVTIGFTSGAALTILSSQLKNLLGVPGEKGNSFIGYWKALIRDFDQFHLADAVLGCISVVILAFMRKLKDVRMEKKSWRETVRIISLSRNVIIIVVTTVISYLAIVPPLKIVGNVSGGVPSPSLPEFQLPIKPLSNNTYSDEINEGHMSFMETLRKLGVGSISIATISVLQNVAISKTFGAGQLVDATQEMIALGVSNVLGGFFQCIPTSASFSRSAVNQASGVRSQLGGLFTGIIVILALIFLTPWFYYIPKASLAAVIISAVVFMIDLKSLKPMWKISKFDVFVSFSTFLTSLAIGMEYGILLGVSISCISYLFKSSKPPVEFHVSDQDLIVCLSNPLTFASVQYLEPSLSKELVKHPEINQVRIDCRQLNSEKYLDYTVTTCLSSFATAIKKSDKKVEIVGCTGKWITAFGLEKENDIGLMPVQSTTNAPPNSSGAFVKMDTKNFN